MKSLVALLLLVLSIAPPTFAQEAAPEAASYAPPSYILFPFGFPGYDFSRRLVNQTPAEPGSRGITLDRYEGGLRSTRQLDLDLMGGVMAMIPWNYLAGVAAGAIPSVGVFPMVGTKVISDRLVSSREEARKLPNPKIPFKAEALEGWKVHDTLQLTVTGGIAFQANIGMMMILSSGPTFIASGTWTSHVEKTGDREAYLKFTRDKLRALSVSNGATLVSVDLLSFHNADESFSFRFDLTQAGAVEAYEDAFRGNLTLAQKLASEGSKAVRLEISARSRKIGHMREISIRIPLLFAASAGSGRIEGQDESISHADGTRSESHFGIYNREKKLRRLHTHRAQSDSFFASVMVNGSQDGPGIETRIGSYGLSYADDHASGKRLGSQVFRFMQKTGLHELASYEFPRKEKLDYASVKLEISFSPLATAALTELGARAELHNELGKDARTLIDAYLSGKNDPDRLCDGETGPKGLDLEACRERLYENAIGSASDAARALRKMKKTSQDAARFSRSYAELGKTLLSNRFVLLTVLGELDPASVEATFRVEGERISKVERRISLE